jgi:hypothetical protein
MLAGYQNRVKIELSKGFMKGGIRHWWITPKVDGVTCHNRSRRASTLESAQRIADRWYSPEVHAYTINGWPIASNNPENALKEYWRVCKREDIGKRYEIVLITHK